MGIGDKIPVVMGPEKGASNGIATLDENGILAEDQRPGPKWPSGTNLLDNWLFQASSVADQRSGYIKPDGSGWTPAGAGEAGAVRGYCVAGYTIDRWSMAYNGTVKIMDDRIRITSPSSSESMNVTQALEETLRGKTATLSALVSGKGLINLKVGSTNFSAGLVDSAVKVMTQRTVNITSDGAISMVIQAHGEFDVYAIKLELGGRQTLAHQEGGEWVLNDPLQNKRLEEIKASMRPASMDGNDGVLPFALGGRSNPNLLDNWYFPDPINQRGITSGTAVGGYGFDRWASNNGAVWSFDKNGLTISTTNHANGIWQMVDVGAPCAGKTYTLSILYNHNRSSGTQTFAMVRVGSLIHYPGIDSNFTGKRLLYNTFTVPEDFDGTTMQLAPVMTNSAISLDVGVVAVKLEEGARQTLAHRENGEWVLNDPPPNRALELEKCRRYYRRWEAAGGNGNTNLTLGVGVSNQFNQTIFYVDGMREAGDVSVTCSAPSDVMLSNGAGAVIEATSVIGAHNSVRNKAGGEIIVINATSTAGVVRTLMIKNGGWLAISKEL